MGQSLTDTDLADLQRNILGDVTITEHFGLRLSPVFVGEYTMSTRMLLITRASRTRRSGYAWRIKNFPRQDGRTVSCHA